MSAFTRIRLFIRDYFDEFGVAWSLARMRDCERNGGHRWGEPTYSNTLQSQGQTCSRCGTWQSVTQTFGTGSTVAVRINATNST